MKKIAKKIFGAVAIGAMVQSGYAAISYSVANSTYAQDFDSLPYTGSNATWTDNATLAGWYLSVRVSPTSGTPTSAASPSLISISNGSSTTGAFFSFGANSSTERALGGLGSGGVYFGNASNNNTAGYWGIILTNNTGLTLTSFTARYDVEQWRDQNTTAQPLVVEWIVRPASTPTPLDWFTGTWTSGASTNSPANANVGAIDGNAAANRVAGVSFSGTPSWANGQQLWIRFRELNDAGNDQALAIDNFTFSAIPEPGTIGMLLGAGALLALRRRLRRS